jgi:hypothetical protein
MGLPEESRRGSRSRDVVSLVIDDALTLSTELASPDIELAWKGRETPEIDEADDVRPPRRCKSFSKWFDGGRRSGNRAWTRVLMSEGLTTMNGWTSTVSRGEVMALAGRRTGFD